MFDSDLKEFNKIIEEIDKTFSEKEIEIIIEYLKINYTNLDHFLDVLAKGGFVYTENEENREKMEKLKKLVDILKKSYFYNPLFPYSLPSKDEISKLLHFILKSKSKELKPLLIEKEKIIDKLQKENNDLKKIINKLNLKQDDLAEAIQKQISQKIKEYEEKIKKLEKENKELKEQLGFYE